MHQPTMTHGERRLLTAEGSAVDTALVAEIAELRERAWGLLVDVSQHCNIKLRDVAVALTVTVQGELLPEAMRREVGRALKRVNGRN